MNLEEQLRGRPFEQIPLKVTSGVLIHIGAGIYNSPAGAIKELISNSFDADATRVVVSTDYPRFEQIRVLDNGAGMTLALFAEAMLSIGTGLKGILQPSRLTPIFERPVIGHLGIGLLALSQVCDKATIESQTPGSDTKFVAQLDFSEFRKRKEIQAETTKVSIFRDVAERYGGIDGMRQRVEELGPEDNGYIPLLTQLELAIEAERVFRERGMEDLEDEHLGYCVVYPGVPAIPGEQGTIITLTEIDEGVRATLMDRDRASDPVPSHYEDMGWDGYRDEVNNWSWDELCKRLQMKTSQLSYESLPSYHRFLWELAVMIPTQYLEGGPVLLEPDLLKQKKEELAHFDFSVIVDNRRLLKPVLLPSGPLAREEKLEREYDCHLETFSKDEEVDGARLKYNGYMFWQRKQVELSAVRGIQIYIRNVGIGPYDRTLMGFSKVNPTSRVGQMSGEIYVEEGLERALNIDRNSFRETDAHHLALQRHLWKLIGSAKRGDGIMGISVDAYWKRRERKDRQLLEEHVEMLAEQVQLASAGRFALDFVDKENPEPYILEGDHVVVFDGSPRWPRSSSERRLYQQVLVSVRAAVAAGASAEQVLALLEKTLLR